MSRRNQRNLSSYKSPLERLDEKTKRYSPKKLSENAYYKDLSEKGECSLFEKQTSPYRYFHIHAETPIDIIDDLIDYAKEITTYTVDTEDQMRYREESLGALIQIEFIHPNDRSIIILVETIHLPPQNSWLFEKISRLCKTIFANGHRIYGWGEITKEMEKMYQYNLFDINDVNAVTEINVQNDFKRWFNQNNPTSIYHRTGHNDEFSLQKAIYLTFNEWLDKRLTLADWGCALDVKSSMFNEQNHRIIDDEIHIRQLMILYAMNDCFSVTKLVHFMSSFDQLTSPPPISSEEAPRYTNDDEQPVMVTEEVLMRDEFSVTIKPNEINRVNENNRSFNFTRCPLDEVHVANELRHDIEKFQTTKTINIQTYSNNISTLHATDRY